MSNNSLINLGELSKPATVLIEKISEGMGGAFRPLQIKRVAKAEAEAAKIKAQSEAEVAKIAAQSEVEVTDLQQRAIQRVVAEEARNQQNMEQIIEDAVPQVDEDANPNDMDNDWIANFFDKSRLVSDSEMQTLWSKVLAGEANSPGNFSKRTVNFIAELEKSEADLFTRLCGFGWNFGGSFHPLVFDETAEIYNRCEINFGSLSHLDSIGLVQFNPTGYKQQNLRRKGNVFYHERPLHLEMSQDSDNNDIPIGKVILTSIGEQLATICSSQPVDGFYDYVRQQWRHHLPWSDQFFDRDQLLSDLLNLCFWDGQISCDKWGAFCFVFGRGGYHYTQTISDQSMSLVEAKEKFLPKIATVLAPDQLIIRIRVGDLPITIPSAYESLYDETEFNSQNGWVNSGSLYVNLRTSQSVGTCVLLYPQGSKNIDSINRKVTDYLRSLISSN